MDIYEFDAKFALFELEDDYWQFILNNAEFEINTTEQLAELSEKLYLYKEFESHMTGLQCTETSDQ